MVVMFSANNSTEIITDNSDNTENNKNDFNNIENQCKEKNILVKTKLTKNINGNIININSNTGNSNLDIDNDRINDNNDYNSNISE